jgi:homogentisate 1,2-dioxygenase
MQIAKRGKLPATPHTEFYAKPDVLALEEIHGTYGFSGPWARKMHVRSYPTEQIAAPKAAPYELPATAAKDDPLQPYLIQTGDMPEGGDPFRSRKAIVRGPNTIVSIAKPNESTPKNTFFRNGEKHEAIYVQDGEGTLSSEFGELPFRKGLYLLVPKGATYRIDLKSKSTWLLIIESSYPITFPPHYMNPGGQATMMAPVVETEIELPELAEPRDEKGTFFVDVKHHGGRVTRLTFGHHPFDVAGWEGALYPFAFDIKNHHGIAREIHTAPPMHQTFESGKAPFSGFSICSFVPQMEGWHPKDIPAPYAHLNVDSDEVMFFSNTKYGARKGFIREGSFTFHPGSMPHSPQGAAALRSREERGKMSERLAVMLDTFFESLEITEEGRKFADLEYPLSWHKAAAAPPEKLKAEEAYGT